MGISIEPRGHYLATLSIPEILLVLLSSPSVAGTCHHTQHFMGLLMSQHEVPMLVGAVNTLPIKPSPYIPEAGSENTAQILCNAFQRHSRIIAQSHVSFPMKIINENYNKWVINIVISQTNNNLCV